MLVPTGGTINATEVCPSCVNRSPREYFPSGNLKTKLQTVEPTLTFDPVVNVYIVKRISDRRELSPDDGVRLLGNFKEYQKLVVSPKFSDFLKVLLSSLFLYSIV